LTTTLNIIYILYNEISIQRSFHKASLKQPPQPDVIRIPFTENYEPSAQVKIVFHMIKIISFPKYYSLNYYTVSNDIVSFAIQKNVYLLNGFIVARDVALFMVLHCNYF